jgi:hypothetical protein
VLTQEIPRDAAILLNLMQIFLAVYLIRDGPIVARRVDVFDSRLRLWEHARILIRV